MVLCDTRTLVEFVLFGKGVGGWGGVSFLLYCNVSAIIK